MPAVCIGTHNCSISDFRFPIPFSIFVLMVVLMTLVEPCRCLLWPVITTFPISVFHFRFSMLVLMVVLMTLVEPCRCLLWPVIATFPISVFHFRFPCWASVAFWWFWLTLAGVCCDLWVQYFRMFLIGWVHRSARQDKSVIYLRCRRTYLIRTTKKQSKSLKR